MVCERRSRREDVQREKRERQERSGFGRSGGGAKAIEEEGETRGKSEAKSTIACYAGSNC